jgi:aryl-alcohol dehydrogenase-like predicted oxidoreductase
MSNQLPSAASMRLGSTDLRVPRLGLGAMVWGDMSAAPRWSPARSAYGPTSSLQEQREALEASIAAGVNLLDTAAMYGKGASERRVGELTQGWDVLVATKFPAGYFARAGSLPETLDSSRARLRRDVIDLYQVHFPTRWMSIPTLMNLMADAVEAGKVRAVGVSNYSARQMREAHAALGRRGLPLASNQVQYSLLHRNPERNGVLQAGRELGVTLIAYMPLASGALTGKYSATHRPAGWRRYMPYFRGKGLATLERVNGVLGELAGRHDRTPSQIALRWLIQQPNVLPIPGAKDGRQAAQNAGALSFELTEAEVETLSLTTSGVGR